jgi:hypothetical protein
LTLFGLTLLMVFLLKSHFVLSHFSIIGIPRKTSSTRTVSATASANLLSARAIPTVAAGRIEAAAVNL